MAKKATASKPKKTFLVFIVKEFLVNKNELIHETNVGNNYNPSYTLSIKLVFRLKKRSFHRFQFISMNLVLNIGP